MAAVKHKLIAFTFVFLFSAYNLAGQFYLSGQAPANVKWRQVTTDHFELVYPESYGTRINRLAGLLEESWKLTGHTLGHSPSPIPVVVYNQNSRANGLVVWAPKRMELYTTPPQSPTGGEWLKHLAVHEQRHVVQIDKLNQGLTGFLFRLLGEQAAGIALVHVPYWFLEGDAVLTETTLTSDGRGRASSFEMPLRTLLLSDKKQYSYDKFLFGSYKDYVPDQYQYGYHVVSALRRKHGPSLWENMLDQVARKPVIPGVFASSIKRQTGMGLSGMNSSILSELKERWQNTAVDGPLPVMSNTRLNRRTGKLYHSYRYPDWVGDSAIIALKSGIGQTDEIVRLDLQGKEESIVFTGHLSSPSLTYSRGRVAWSEFRPDVRWGLRQFSEIRIFDMNSGIQRRVSSKSRYFAPEFASDGLFLAVVEVDLQNSSFITIINSVTGKVSARYPGPYGKEIQQPAYNLEGKEILVTSVGEEGTGIMALDLETGLWDELVSPVHANISGVFPCGEMVCFHSDISGTDNLYALNAGSGKLFRLTGSGTGAFEGSLSSSGEKLAWSEYTADGNDLVMSPFNKAAMTGFEFSAYADEENLNELVSHEAGTMRDEPYLDMPANSKPYKKGLNLFRFHSWSPFYYDYTEFNIREQPVKPGITLVSQNLLGTASTILGYSYDNRRHVAHGRFIYRGFWPVLEAGFDYGAEPLVYSGRDTTGPGPVTTSAFNFNGSISLPLNFSAGRHIAGIEPVLKISYDNGLYHYDGENTYKRGMTTIQTRFVAWRYRRMSRRDLSPEWGQVLRWQRRSAPFEDENLGSINAVEMTLYFPGILPYHSLQIDAAVQRQKPVKYYFSDITGFPRGYSGEPGEELLVLRSGYLFPLMYPDFSLPGVLYLKRVNAGLFADAGINGFPVVNEQTGGREWHDDRLFSWGGSLAAEFHLFRLITPFNVSMGVARLQPEDEYTFLFSFGIDLGVF